MKLPVCAACWTAVPLGAKRVLNRLRTNGDQDGYARLLVQVIVKMREHRVDV